MKRPIGERIGDLRSIISRKLTGWTHSPSSPTPSSPTKEADQFAPGGPSPPPRPIAALPPAPEAPLPAPKQLGASVAAAISCVPGLPGVIQMIFGPEDLPEEQLVRQHAGAAEHLYSAFFSMTSEDLVDVWIAKKEAGVDVRLITDKMMAEGKAQRKQMRRLYKAKVPIKVNIHGYRMHLKISEGDGKWNTNGSFNPGDRGTKNDERLDIINEPQSSEEVKRKFLGMWNDEERFEEWTPDLNSESEDEDDADAASTFKNA